MKKIYKLVLLVFFLSSLFSCEDTGKENNIFPFKDTLNFSINGVTKSFYAFPDSHYDDTGVSYIYYLTWININNPIEVFEIFYFESDPLEEGQSYTNISADYDEPIDMFSAKRYSTDSLNLTITRYDTPPYGIMEGNFSGTFTLEGGSDTIEISGSFVTEIIDYSF